MARAATRRPKVDVAPARHDPHQDLGGGPHEVAHPRRQPGQAARIGLPAQAELDGAEPAAGEDHPGGVVLPPRAAQAAGGL